LSGQVDGDPGETPLADSPSSLPANRKNLCGHMNCLENTASSPTRNGVRMSHGMTTTNGLKDELYFSEIRMALTQTTKV